MALDSGSLASQLLSLFTMDMTDDSYSNGIAEYINAYVPTGTIMISPVAGTCSSPSGTFKGAATGTMTITLQGSDIKQISTDMLNSVSESTVKYDPTKPTSDANPDLSNIKGNAYIANRMATLIDEACTAAVFIVTISGTTTTPTPAEIPTTDVGICTWKGDTSQLESDLLDCMSSDSFTNESYAQDFAQAVTDYLASATITCIGSTILAGSTGIGNMS